MSSLSRPVAALAWKEWREQRPIIMAGLALSAALPLILLAGMEAAGRNWTFSSLVQALPAVNVLIIWPLLAVIAGSTTISNEMAEGTLGFLLSRPVARRTIWLMKVIFGFISVVAVTLGSLLVYWGCRSMMAGGTGAIPFESAIELVLDFNPTVELIVACIFFIFTAGVFFSTFISRALTAAAAGMLFALVLLPVVFLVWVRIDVYWIFEAGFIGFEICLAGFLTLSSSMYLFTRNEGRSRVGRSLATGIVMIAGGLLLLSAPMVYAHVRVSPETAYVTSAFLSPRGDRVITEVTGENSLVEEIWSIPFDGQGHSRLTDRYAEFQSISPEGRWIAYLSNRGLFGLRSDLYSLRISRTDGSKNRLIVADVPHDGDYVAMDVEFSPDGTMFAYTIEDTLYIGHVLDGDPVGVRLRDSGCQDPSVVGWTRHGEEVLLLSTPTCLVAFDPVLGRYRTIVEDEDDPRVFWGAPRNGFRYLPLVSDIWSESKKLSVVDVESGERRMIAESACSAGEMSPDGLRMSYAVCEKDGDWYRSELRVHDIESGSERFLGGVRGRTYDLHLSPTGSSVAARIKDTNEFGEEQKTIIATEGGSPRLLEGYQPLGWRGPGQLVIVQAGHDGARFALVDVETGRIEKFFPRE